MARAPDDRKPSTPAKRRPRSFRRAAAPAREVIDAVAQNYGFVEADVLLNWSLIAGAELARVCEPVRVQYGDRALGATLIVRTTSARAPEVEHSGPAIVEKVNQHYGYRAIRRLKITQGTGHGRAAVPGFAEPAEPFAGPGTTGASTPAPTEAETAEAAELAATIESPGLRAALTRMGAHVLAQERRGPPRED